ncbi:MAG: 2-oxoacid:acceptor oxidoreductase family protein [Planctomycetaceae bacterium]|nr:2-oxoacid:acceptor oxidoreductase family protein [Planctomycetaceae bacterium]
MIKPLSFFETFSRKSGEQGTTHYCPGCGHGIIHKLLAEAIDELGIQNQVILITPVGCAVFAYYYFETSAVSAAHGRAPAVGTAVSRLEKNAVTISYQGDGDLAAIGMSHTIHAANRGEKMIVIFVNNNTYGMTGGQLAPTSLLEQKTTTSPLGRQFENEGPPLKMAEMIAMLKAPVFVARTAVNNPKNVRETRKIIRRGLQAQAERKGYVFLEILAACPTNWHLSPGDACEWIEKDVIKEFPLGVFKDRLGEKESTIGGVFPEISSAGWVEKLFDTTEETLETFEGDLKENLENITLPLKIKCAGFGGQGVLSLGLGFANLATDAGLEVTWLPSYGPEMRGGVANCSVVIGTQAIGSPFVDCPDILIAMNQPSLTLFGPTVPEQGHIFYNQSLVNEIPAGLVATLHAVDATNIADQIGNPKVCNTVFLGSVLKKFRLFPLEMLRQFVKKTFPDAPKLCQDNTEALESGWKIAENP